MWKLNIVFVSNYKDFYKTDSQIMKNKIDTLKYIMNGGISLAVSIVSLTYLKTKYNNCIFLVFLRKMIVLRH